MMSIKKVVGANLRGWRQNAGLSQADLARRLGVSRQAIHRYERGLARISAEMLVEAARATGQEPFTTKDDPAGVSLRIDLVFLFGPAGARLTEEDRALLEQLARRLEAAAGEA